MIKVAHKTTSAPAPQKTSIALVLGGGGARGLAHILVLEVFDELGLKPDQIVGTSIGAVFGAAYASGLSAEEIREQAINNLGKRTEILKKLFAHKPETLFSLWNLSPLSSSFMKPEALLNKILPDNIAQDFGALRIPLKTIATDYNTQMPIIIEEGSLITAIAASIALPTIFTPVLKDGMALIDGGLTNPLPIDVIAGQTDLSIAIDVTGGPVRNKKKELPSMINVLLTASQISQNAIIRQMLKTYTPDILIRPPVDRFQVLAFYKIKEILESSLPIKDELKHALDEALTRAAL